MGSQIVVRDLRKSYGDFEAVRGLSFEVQTGEVFGLLGPNGAGKTTTVEILEGLRGRTSGTVSVCGYDPGSHSRQLKERVGVCLQSTNLPEKIRVGEALRLFASLYAKRTDIDQLMQQLQLTEKRQAFYEHLSGGQKQRLALALALINDPQVLFLDEPTSGLDPQARHEIHLLVTRLKQERRTVVLTTHYIEEAEKLCDRVAIIDAGRILALGSPREIQEQTLGHSLIDVTCESPIPAGELPSWKYGVSSALSEDRRHLSVVSSLPARTLVQVVKWLDSQGLELTDANLKRPSLEDVFMKLTGRSLRE